MALAYHESNIVTYSACLFTEKSGPANLHLPRYNTALYSEYLLISRRI